MESGEHTLKLSSWAYFEAYYSAAISKDKTLEERAEIAKEKTGLIWEESWDRELMLWFFSKRAYDLEEYYTGRELYNQLAASARQAPADPSSQTYDAVFKTKTANFFQLAEVKKRLVELEDLLFIGDKKVINMFDDGKLESLIAGSNADKFKGGSLL